MCLVISNCTGNADGVKGGDGEKSLDRDDDGNGDLDTE